MRDDGPEPGDLGSGGVMTMVASPEISCGVVVPCPPAGELLDW